MTSHKLHSHFINYSDATHDMQPYLFIANQKNNIFKKFELINFENLTKGG